MARETKQDVLDSISADLGLRHWVVSTGSTELKDALVEIAQRLGVQVDPTRTKPEIAAAIARAGGQGWDESCDSTASPSGGGSTVTLEGLRRVRAAVSALGAS